MELHFDASIHSGGSQADAWRALTSRLFYCAGRRLSASPALAPARLASMELGGLHLVEVTAPPGTSTRDRECLRSDGVDALFVSTMASGRARVEAGRVVLTQNAGDVVIWDAAQPHRWVHEDATVSLCVRVPRALFRTSDPARLAVRALPAQTAAGALAASLIRGVARLNVRRDSASAHRLRSAVLDTLLAALAVEPGEASHERLDDARDHILACLDDPTLSPARTARAIGMSERALARIFAAAGTTYSRWLWRQRLDHAHRLLAQGEADSVAAAAVASGFTSFAHFSRAFRQAHGIAPSALLRRS